MRWVRSGGGPLVCVARSVAQSWCGVLGTSDPFGDCVAASVTDYDRACSTSGYVATLEVRGAPGLTIGDVPLLTSFHRGPSLTAIVSIYYAPDDFDVGAELDRVTSARLGSALAITRFNAPGGEMMMFDAALNGADVDEDAVAFTLDAGAYAVSTHVLEDVSDVSLVIHAFSRMS